MAETVVWSVDDVARHLRSSSLFGGLDESALRGFAEIGSVRLLPAGETLMCEGDPGQDAFVVVAGRLDVLVRAADGSERSINQLGSGEVVGEMALLTDDPRSATVRARRDSALVRIPSEDFRRIVLEHPGALLELTRTVMQRLSRSIHQSDPVEVRTVVAIRFMGTGATYDGFAPKLAAAFGVHQTVILTSSDVYEALGEQASVSEITQFLHRVEDQNRYVLLVSDGSERDWPRLCERQSDVTLLVGGIAELRDDHAAHEQEQESAGSNRQLVLVHGDDPPRGTGDILERHGVMRHHHVRPGSNTDIERVARIVHGESVGVVFGGGGARGFAHLGVLKAMIEADLPLDHVGGSSIGSSIASAYATGWDWSQIYELVRWVTFERGRLVDATLPGVSVASGRRLVSGMIEGYGDVEIEDLWTDFYCVSSDLAEGAIHLHTSGPVWAAVRASIAIPGVFPPMRSADGHVLVDGGVLDNVPTAAMKEIYAPNTLIAVDLRAPHRMAAQDLPDDGALSGWQVARHRLLPWRDRLEVPGIIETLIAASTVSGSTNGDDADMIIRPPVADFGFMDFASCDSIVDAGYRHAVEVFERDGLPG